jgi:hypothetical protein
MATTLYHHTHVYIAALLHRYSINSVLHLPSPLYVTKVDLLLRHRLPLAKSQCLPHCSAQIRTRMLQLKSLLLPSTLRSTTLGVDWDGSPLNGMTRLSQHMGTTAWCWQYGVPLEGSYMVKITEKPAFGLQFLCCACHIAACQSVTTQARQEIRTRCGLTQRHMGVRGRTVT